jgi:streptomycin 6-kinase
MDALDRFLSATTARLGSGADAWIEGAPMLLDRLVERWELELQEPAAESADSLKVAALRSGTEPVWVKLAFPDGWFAEEVAALARWDGRGVVTLIDHDPAGAQLLERPEPGTSLAAEEDEVEALGRALEVAERLWIPDPGGITTLTAEALEWSRTMPGRHHLIGRPFERSLAQEAAGWIRELAPTQGPPVLLHGDLRRATVVAARGGLWLATDPRPLVGERTFDVASLLREGHAELAADPVIGRERIRHRFDALTERSDVDPDRLRRWAVAVATDQALWSFEAGDAKGGEQQVEVAKMILELQP